MNLIGLSLSFCIQEIIEGKVNKADVSYIIARTSFRNQTEFQEVIDLYKKVYWRNSPGIAEYIAKEFFERGQIRQPKLTGEKHPGTQEGIWREIV